MFSVRRWTVGLQLRAAEEAERGSAPSLWLSFALTTHLSCCCCDSRAPLAVDRLAVDKLELSELARAAPGG